MVDPLIKSLTRVSKFRVLKLTGFTTHLKIIYLKNHLFWVVKSIFQIQKLLAINIQIAVSKVIAPMAI